MRSSNEIYRGQNAATLGYTYCRLKAFYLAKKLRSGFNRENSPSIGARLQDREIGNWRAQGSAAIRRMQVVLYLDRSLGSE